MLEPYFSFEREHWQQVQGASLKFCRFERFLDRPVLVPGPKNSPDEHRLEATSVIRTGDHFKMWYTGLRLPPKNVWKMENRLSVCLATSEDGVTWEKPNLDLVPCETGEAPNNVVAGVGDYAYGSGVMQEQDRFVMQYCHPRGIDVEEGQTTFSIATSRDGIHWKGRRRPCTDVQHFEPANDIFYHRGYYWVLGQGVSPYFNLPGYEEIGRVMFVYRSRDLKKWTRVKNATFHYPIPEHFPRSSLQVHCGATAWLRGRVLLGFMGQFWPAGFSELVGSTFGLVYSYDGANWSEPFSGEPLLMPKRNEWDCGMLLQGKGAYSRGEHTYYWYSALNGGNLWSPKGSVGVVRMRRDGFAYYAADGADGADLLTSPIEPAKARRWIYLNLETARRSPVKLSVVDVKKKRVLRSVEISKSGVLCPAAYVDARENAALRIQLPRQARLYGYYLGEQLDTDAYLAEWT